MTPAAKITYSLALLIGLSIGTVYGFRTTTNELEIYYDGIRMTAPDTFANFAYLQYRRADPEHARAALETFANFLEAMEKFSPESTRKQELANTYTRLALVEDAANHPEQARDFIVKARHWYTANGGQDHSDSEMKAAVKTMDERLRH